MNDRYGIITTSWYHGALAEFGPDGDIEAIWCEGELAHYSIRRAEWLSQGMRFADATHADLCRHLPAGSIPPP